MGIERRSLPIAVVLVIYAVWFGRTLLVKPADLIVAMVADFATMVVLPAGCLYALYRLGGAAPSVYWVKSPFATRPKSEVLSLGFFSALLLLTYVIVWNVVGGASDVGPSVERSQDLGGASALVLVVYSAASAAISEEIFWRGLPRILIARPNAGTCRVLAYVVCFSAMFGLMHWPDGVPGVIATTYFGIVASLILLWTNNLWYPIFGHFVADVVVMWWRYEKTGFLPI